MKIKFLLLYFCIMQCLECCRLSQFTTNTDYHRVFFFLVSIMSHVQLPKKWPLPLCTVKGVNNVNKI